MSSYFDFKILSLTGSIALYLSCSTAAPGNPSGFGEPTSKATENADQSSGEDSSPAEASTTQTSASSSTSDESKTLGCEDGSLRECSQLPNGEKIQFPGDIPRGNCKKGFQRCRFGGWGHCQSAIAPAPHDDCAVAGDDANCNGMPNEGCACVDTQDPRPCGQSDVGACRMGTQSCKGGIWQACEGETKPARERCDGRGIDEDCDGQSDLEDSDCECTHGAHELCSLPAKGDCSLGHRICSKGGWSKCQPRFPFSARETCGAPRKDAYGTAIGDEDCDGKVDNHPVPGLAPLGCTYYMIDEDKDGFGAIGPNFAVDTSNYTYGCFCRGHVPDPAMVLSLHANYNQDCGDCKDEGDLVHPGITQYSKTASSCLKQVKWPYGAFDFNCDKNAEKQGAALSSCVEQSGTCSSNQGDWYMAVPPCGETGKKGTACENSTPPCELSAGFSVDTQACR